MIVIETHIPEVLILEPKVFKDERGYFFESFSQKAFDEVVRGFVSEEVRFVQDNESLSSFGVMRGLHFQRPPYSQAKLVRCVRGLVLDVAVDIRKGSPTFGQFVAVELSEENHRQLFIPKGFAHGFSVLSQTALTLYKCDAYYAPQAESGISLLDPSLGIDWRVLEGERILSPKDMAYPLLSELDNPFEYNNLCK